MATSEATVKVAGNPMSIFVATPTQAGPRPALVLIHHRDGVDEFTKRASERYAAEGFVTVAPNLYHRRPLGEESTVSRTKLDDGEIVADINATVAYLQALPNVNGNAIGILGHCMGGRMSFLGAASNPAFKAAAMFYGGSIFVAQGNGTPAPFALAKNIKCPVAGFFGKEDKNPSPDDVAKISAEFKRLNIRHDFKLYDGTGHAFQNFTNTATYRPESSDDAWRRAIAFFNTELGGGR
jgi:carboxymethylenebutenolidase